MFKAMYYFKQIWITFKIYTPQLTFLKATVDHILVISYDVYFRVYYFRPRLFPLSIGARISTYLRLVSNDFVGHFDEETKSTCVPKCQAVIKWQRKRNKNEKNIRSNIVHSSMNSFNSVIILPDR